MSQKSLGLVNVFGYDFIFLHVHFPTCLRITSGWVFGLSYLKNISICIRLGMAKSLLKALKVCKISYNLSIQSRNISYFFPHWKGKTAFKDNYTPIMIFPSLLSVPSFHARKSFSENVWEARASIPARSFATNPRAFCFHREHFKTFFFSLGFWSQSLFHLSSFQG